MVVQSQETWADWLPAPAPAAPASLFGTNCFGQPVKSLEIDYSSKASCTRKAPNVLLKTRSCGTNKLDPKEDTLQEEVHQKGGMRQLRSEARGLTS